MYGQGTTETFNSWLRPVPVVADVRRASIVDENPGRHTGIARADPGDSIKSFQKATIAR
jgi:hypothetical protein